MLRRRRDLIRIIEEDGIDVVQTRGLGTLGFLVMTLRDRVRVWWTIENVTFMVREEHQRRHRWLFRPKRAAHRLLYRIGGRLVSGIVVVSEETDQAFRRTVGYRGGGVVVVPNGVDVERYPERIDRTFVRGTLGFGPGDHVMTMVGTFKRQKGHRYLIEAAERVLPTDLRVHLVLVGDGDLMERVRAQVRGAGLADRIHFLRSRRDVPALLAASDSFILPSLWEGQSVALVEAMASRLPIIATAVSGTTHVMVDGNTGWLVPPGDPNALAAAMVELLTDPIRAASMAEAARARVVASFGAEQQAEQLASLFRGEVGARRAPAPARTVAL
jgi:glycosyltransferase involved in cell wall biosynthesis